MFTHTILTGISLYKSYGLLSRCIDISPACQVVLLPLFYFVFFSLCKERAVKVEIMYTLNWSNKTSEFCIVSTSNCWLVKITWCRLNTDHVHDIEPYKISHSVSSDLLVTHKKCNLNRIIAQFLSFFIAHFHEDFTVRNFHVPLRSVDRSLCNSRLSKQVALVTLPPHKFASLICYYFTLQWS